MKTKTHPATKTKIISLEGWENKRLAEARDVLLTFKAESIVEAEQAIIALDLFVLAMTPKTKPPALPFQEPPTPLTPVRR